MSKQEHVLCPPSLECRDGRLDGLHVLGDASGVHLANSEWGQVHTRQYWTAAMVVLDLLSCQEENRIGDKL